MLSSSSVPDDVTCFDLLHHVFTGYATIPPRNDRVADTARAESPKRLRYSGSLQRLPGLVGMMREIIIRHSAMNYGQLLSRCVQRVISLIQSESRRGFG